MILTCPECSSAFVVKVAALKPNGRKVKCTKCAHVWFQEPYETADEVKEQVKVEDIPDGGNVPAVVDGKKKRVFQIVAIAVASLYIMTLPLTADSTLSRWMPWMYGMFGAVNVNNIRISDVVVDRILGEKYDGVKIAGNINNTSTSERYPAALRVKFNSEAEGNVMEYSYHFDGIEIVGPGASQPFEFTVDKIPTSVTEIILDYGNGMSLTAR